MENRNGKSRVIPFMGGLFCGLFFALLGLTIVLGVKSAKSGALNLFKETETSQELLDESTVRKIKLLEDKIDEVYLNEIDDTKMEDGLYKGMVASLEDPYSAYYSLEEVKEFTETTAGEYSGIGAYIGMDEDSGYPKITKVIEGSPALEAGLKSNDFIVKIDGESVEGLELNEVVKRVKGEENSQVVITIARKDAKDYLDITVTRKKIEMPTVTYSISENGIAYISILEFDDVTSSQFAEKFDQAKSDGMKGLILDLRNNPGGNLDTVIKISDFLLPRGLLVYTEDKNGERDEYRMGSEDEIDVPMIVLVNENSASAAEILAGAVQDYKKGKLLGTTTFGKGIVQQFFRLNDGSAVKLTISKYFTPLGRDIHKIGVEPDIVLEFDYENYDKNKTDNQREKAYEILSGEIR